MTIKMMKTKPSAQVPKPSTDGAAGMDLRACIDSPILIKPGERQTIPTGLAIAIPGNSSAAFIYARSGLGIKKGITLSNCVGIIDSDYRGEICVGLINLSDENYELQPNERIAQMVIAPVLTPHFQECDSLDETDRGAGGFGSTGRL